MAVLPSEELMTEALAAHGEVDGPLPIEVIRRLADTSARLEISGRMPIR